MSRDNPVKIQMFTEYVMKHLGQTHATMSDTPRVPPPDSGGDGKGKGGG